jgi:hypothetical protein
VAECPSCCTVIPKTQPPQVDLTEAWIRSRCRLNTWRTGTHLRAYVTVMEGATTSAAFAWFQDPRHGGLSLQEIVAEVGLVRVGSPR